tara:strand:- start:44 stop:352 length:309 start_codon:yes stop_codon:yes gene_type:complete
VRISANGSGKRHRRVGISLQAGKTSILASLSWMKPKINGKKASEGEMNDLKELADYTDGDDENEPDYDPIAEQRAEDEMIERQIEDEPERLAELRQIQENAT